MRTLRDLNLLFVFLVLFAQIVFAEEISTERFQMLINHQFHLDANHKFTFYDFPIKDKEHIIKTEQEMTIKNIISNTSGVFYEVSLSKERYHYYIDALLLYSKVSGDEATFNKLLEEEQLKLIQNERERKEEEAKSLEEASKRLEEIIVRDREERRREEARLIKKWGKKTVKAIMEEKVFIGMTKAQVKASWGSPKDINRSVGSWGVHEQWIYGDFGPYLYFENGRLTAFQD